jgi:hypothetical protein
MPPRCSPDRHLHQLEIAAKMDADTASTEENDRVFYAQQQKVDEHLKQHSVIGKTKSEILRTWGKPESIEHTHGEHFPEEWWYYGTHMITFIQGKCNGSFRMVIWH